MSPSVSDPTSAGPPAVLIFRKRMLAYSETFIAEQGRHLPTWQPIFTGLERDHSGAHLLEGPARNQLCILPDRDPVPAWSRFAYKRLGLLPQRWLQRLREFKALLIHAHFGPDALACLPLARRLGLPLIATFHGFDICINQPMNAYRRHRSRVFAEATAVIAVSQFIAERLRAHGCPNDKIIRHAIGIDTEAFSADDAADSQSRRDILFVGRLVEKKGCADLIAAMHHLDGAQHQHRLHIVGDGPEQPRLSALAQGLGERVVFHGRKTPDEIREHLRRAALFCVPSITGSNGDAEGLGMVFLEAQAMGTPVVSTRSGGIPEAVRDGESGLLVPERSPEALAIALRRLLDDEALRQRFAACGQTHVREHFDVRRQSAALEAIYQRCCDQHHAG